jgi:hypothetical protein
MFAIPALMPVTFPDASTIAIVVLSLLQLPPGVPLLLNVMIDPGHTEVSPLIAPAFAGAVTVTVVVFSVVPHVFVTEYVIVAVPAATPFTIPVAGSMVTEAVLLLLHVPPEVVLNNWVLLPAQTVDVPVIAGTTGNEPRVTTAFPVMSLIQPVALLIALIVYVPAVCGPKSRPIPNAFPFWLATILALFFTRAYVILFCEPDNVTFIPGPEQ